MTQPECGGAAGAERNEGRYAYPQLDRVIHERARLGILSSLSAHHEGLSFADLKELCTLTDGNLSRHLQLLVESGLVEITKTSRRNRPQTICTLTRPGRERFLAYVSALEQVVRDAEAATRPVASPASSSLSGGLSPA